MLVSDEISNFVNSIEDKLKITFKYNLIIHYMTDTFDWAFIDKHPYEYVSKIRLNKLTKLKNLLDHHYYNDESKISDNSYDIILDYMKSHYKIDSTIGAEVTRNKVELPVTLPSMDKVKADSGDLQKWTKKYFGKYVLTDKLDGVSLLVFKNKNTPCAYTRGDSKYGQDISWILKYIHIGTIPDNHMIRGELIISKSNFKIVKNKYHQYSNSRNFVSGYVGRKTINPEIMRLIDFVAYELIVSQPIIPSEGLDILRSNGFNVVDSYVETSIDNSLVSKYLLERREQGAYEIDGIIITDDNARERVSKTGKNPDYARAFKMVLDDQTAEVMVQQIKWEPSMHGIINPVVQINSVILDNVKISNVTGYNANYIINNNIGGCIGPGSTVLITRSGGVIPKILKVINPYKYSEEDCLPKEYKYTWTASNIDIVLTNPDESLIVTKKRIAHFFKTIDVDYFKKGIINKVVDSGYDSVDKILDMDKYQFLQIDGIRDKLADKIYHEIHTKYGQCNLANIMAGSCCFGYGIGIKLIESILSEIPDILENKMSDDILYSKINSIKGLNNITANKFLNNFKKFKNFNDKLPKIKNTATKVNVKGNKFNGMKILFTGFRPDTGFKTYIVSNGGIIKDTFTKDVSLLVVKDINNKSGQKYKKALARNIPIIQLSDL